MKKWHSGIFKVLLLVSLVILAGCGGDDAVTSGDQVMDDAVETGTLAITANGEEFSREGFLSKDGWELTFDQIYATMGNIVAYQSDPPYDTDQGWDIGYKTMVELAGSYTVNLADPQSNPIFLDQLHDVPAGHYNALSWDMLRAVEGPSAGHCLLLVGQAEKEGVIIDFSLGIEQEVAYMGGDYIGDERKGVLLPGGTADLEMTFHFDHLFGVGEEDAADSLNLEAFGFEPLAVLAVDGILETDLTALQVVLNDDDYALLISIMTHLAHVGEGHCLAQFIQ
ncbi:MAG: DUF4382 domain-containing protein [Clostridia bacterium]|nr:DUF4382 domain-containing protein [Clostridia bacterium]